MITFKQTKTNCEIGDTFLVDGIPHILASANENKECILVSLNDGRRWDNAVSVSDCDNITPDELGLISKDCNSIVKVDFEITIK